MVLSARTITTHMGYNMGDSRKVGKSSCRVGHRSQSHCNNLSLIGPPTQENTRLSANSFPNRTREGNLAHRRRDSNMPSNDALPESTAITTPAIANPAPLGLCAFGLTTFVLSSANAGLFTGAEIVLSLAFFYGGLAQLLAGMWEFKTGNTFGATAFTSYGAFWLSLALSITFKKLMIPNGEALGFFLLGWTIFTAIMFLATLRLNTALILLFAFLLATFACLTAGEFLGTGGAGVHKVAGFLGIVTAAIAWYTALAGLLSSGKSAFTLPVGTRP